MIKALIGSAISNKDKGGQIVKQEKPAMQPFVTEVERVKAESVSTPSVSLLPPAPVISDSSGEKVGGQKPKGVRPKARLISKKLSALKSLFKNRSKTVRSNEEKRRKDTEKEKRGKRENLLEKMKIGGIASAVAPITRPFMSFWDQVLNAVGSIVLALIGKWAIDNPEVFVGAIKVLEKALDTIANVFVATIDLFASIIDGVDRIERGLGSFIKGTFGDDAFNALEKMGGNLTQLFDASLLLGGLLLQYTLSELAESDGPDSKDKPSKDKPGKQKISVSEQKSAAKASVKPVTKPTSIQDTAIGSPQRKLAAKIQRQHGHTARRIFENKYDELIRQGKSPYQANKSAKAAVDRSLKKGQIKSQPQTGNLLGRKLKQKTSLRQKISRAPRQTIAFLKKNRMRINWGGPATAKMPAVTRGARALSEYGMGAARAGAKSTGTRLVQAAKTAPAKVAGGFQQIFGKGIDRATERFFIKVLGKGGVQGLKKVMGKIPVIGPLLVFGLNWASGESILRSGAMAVGSGLGQVLGGWAGGAMGAIGGPLAPVTVPLGGFVGSMLGGMGGEFLGGWLYDLFIKTNPDGSGGMNSSGEVAKKFGTGIKELFNKDWGKIGKGFVTWLLKTLRGIGSTAWDILSSMVDFMGGVSLVKAIMKVFNDMKYAVGKGLDYLKNLRDPRNVVKAAQAFFTVADQLRKLFISPGPWGFLYDNAIKPFFKNVTNLWNSRDKFWSFLTRRGTFQEITGAISGAASSAGQGLAGAAAGATQAATSGSPFTSLATPAPTGGAGGNDFWTLVAVASREDGDPQGRADVAQSIYNRLASGAYGGKSIRELILRTWQYEPTWRYPKGPTKGNGNPNPEWFNITDAASAAKAAGLTTAEIHKTSQAILNKNLQDNARQFVQGRTDFTGYSKSSGSRRSQIQRKSGDNYFGWDFNYSQNKVASVPKFSNTGTSTPTTQTLTPPATATNLEPTPSPTAVRTTPPQVSMTPGVSASAQPAQIAPSSPSTPTSAATSTISQQADYDKSGKVNPLLLPLPSPGGQSGMIASPSSGGAGMQGVTNSWVLNYYYIQQISAFLYKQG